MFYFPSVREGWEGMIGGVCDQRDYMATILEIRNIRLRREGMLCSKNDEFDLCFELEIENYFFVHHLLLISKKSHFT